MTIVSLRISNSGGPARPRNTAIAAAKGEWLALLDSDDWWDDSRLEAVRSQLSESIDLLYHPLRVVRGPGAVKSPERRRVLGEPMQGDALQHMALWGNPIPNSAVTVRRSSLLQVGGFSEEASVVEDFDAWMRLAEAGARFSYLPKILGTYWLGGDGISAFSQRQIEQEEELFRRHLHFFDTAYRDQARACHHYRMGSMLLQLGSEPESAYGHLARATALPTFALRLKRLLKLAQARYRAGAGPL